MCIHVYILVCVQVFLTCFTSIISTCLPPYPYPSSHLPLHVTHWLSVYPLMITTMLVLLINGFIIQYHKKHSVYIEITQVSSPPQWETLLGNLGGSLGLFVGVSMVSIMEVLELLLDLLLLALRRPPRIERPPTSGRKDTVGRKRGSPTRSLLSSTRKDLIGFRNIKRISPYMSPSRSVSSSMLLASSVMSSHDDQLSQDTTLHGPPIHAAVSGTDLKAVKKELENLSK